MRVRIVCYEDVNRWILGKFAIRLEDNLKKMGVTVDIDNVPDLQADINHHIIYGGYGTMVSSIDTLMITHIDDLNKLTLLKKQMQTAKMGICMSKETMVHLNNLGIPRSKLCYVNPAHDGILKPRPYIVGITCRVQNDGRKREYMLDKLADKLDPSIFSFKIMGEFWTPHVIKLQCKGFDVEYYEKFNYELYTKLIQSLDYYLYMGQDEGQMGFVDALAAGVKTIVTPQGYHLDAINGISHPFNTMNELIIIFSKIAEERRKLVQSISSWNWQDYTIKHYNIWNYLLNLKDSKNDKFINNSFPDGIMSISEFDNKKSKGSFLKKNQLLAKMLKERIRHSYYYKKNKGRGY